MTTPQDLHLTLESSRSTGKCPPTKDRVLRSTTFNRSKAKDSDRAKEIITTNRSKSSLPVINEPTLNDNNVEVLEPLPDGSDKTDSPKLAGSPRPRSPHDVSTHGRRVSLAVTSRQQLDSLSSLETRRQTRNPNFNALRCFQEVTRKIILLLKATKDTRRNKQLIEKKTLSFFQIGDELKCNIDQNSLVFDPSVFKAQREIQISSEVKTILSTNPSQRTEAQLHLARIWLHQAVQAFSEFPIRLQRSLVKVGWYEKFESKRIIIWQGHKAENFYLILSGTAVVTIMETQKTGESVVRTVAVLNKGNSFGELALMHGAKRSATVTCKEAMELLAVGREDFVDIFMHVEKGREPEHIRFLRQIDILQGWPFECLPYNNPSVCLVMFFRRGIVMCKDSNASEWIYVIMSGSCSVLKSLEECKPNIPRLKAYHWRPLSSTSTVTRDLYSVNKQVTRSKTHRPKSAKTKITAKYQKRQTLL